VAVMLSILYGALSPTVSGAKACKPLTASNQFPSVFETTAEGMLAIKWRMLGHPRDSVWGHEHVPAVVEIANATRGHCVFLEVGAHVGWLVLLARRLGCTVFAWELSPACVRTLRSNLQLNGLDEHPGGIFTKAVGHKAGSRIDADVPHSTHVSLLKMDIDGPDGVAMLGVETLFQQKRIDYVNIEYGGAKQAKLRPRYLHEMHARGFDVYLLDCYAARTYEHLLRAWPGSMLTCLNHSPEVPSFNRSATHLGQLVDVPSVQPVHDFLRCLVANPAIPGSYCSRLLENQRIPLEHFSAFTRGLGQGEVDLMLKRR